MAPIIQMPGSENALDVKGEELVSTYQLNAMERSGVVKNI
jgi:hypothetical protein